MRKEDGQVLCLRPLCKLPSLDSDFHAVVVTWGSAKPLETLPLSSLCCKLNQAQRASNTGG